VLLGNCGGSFNTPPFTYTIGQTPRALTLGDFKEYGWTDLALVRSGQTKVVVRFATGTGSSGERIFANIEREQRDFVRWGKKCALTKPKTGIDKNHLPYY
jgi:hypothetical protein